MSECIEFEGYRNPRGYGRIMREGRNWLATRWFWTQAHGTIPDGLYVLHKCDNPPCINLDHLYLGTAADNARDASERGRLKPLRGPRKTHCDLGHALSGDNEIIEKTEPLVRRCRTCRNAWSRERYEARKAIA